MNSPQVLFVTIVLLVIGPSARADLLPNNLWTFLDEANVALAGRDFNVSGQSPGWNGSIATSSFQRPLQRLAVPAGATQLRVNFASGGAASVTGTMVIDDLSVSLSKPLISDVTADSSGVTITWFSAPNKIVYRALRGRIGRGRNLDAAGNPCRS
jgi:hypothetical protein